MADACVDMLVGNLSIKIRWPLDDDPVVHPNSFFGLSSFANTKR